MVKIKIHRQYEGAWSDATRPLLCLDTGMWRSQRPVVDPGKCNYCGMCALFCPTQCMLDRDDHFVPDFDYCKGCGICARECKREAIRLLPEGEFRDDEG